MKKLGLLWIIGLCIWQTAKADLGNCVVYEANFYLNDGRVFNGYLEYSGYEDAAVLGEDGRNRYCSNTGLLELLQKIQQEGDFWNWEDGGTQGPEEFGKIAIYKSMTYVQLNSKQDQKHSFFHLGFVDSEDVVFIDLSDVDRLVFLGAHYSERNWLTTELVFGQSDMLRVLSDEEYHELLLMDLEAEEDSLLFTSPDPMWGVALFNYNADHDSITLKALAREQLYSLTNWRMLEATVIEKYAIDNSGEDFGCISRQVEEARERYFQELREWFWERGILIVQVWGTC